MTKKRKLSDLVKQETQPASSSEPSSKEILVPPASSHSQSEPDELPKYLTLVRKETRLGEEQIERLSHLSRQLNRKRNGKGERITENTLIRIAVDLLLEQQAQLIGTTEAELRNSVNLKVTE